MWPGWYVIWALLIIGPGSVCCVMLYMLLVTLFLAVYDAIREKMK